MSVQLQATTVIVEPGLAYDVRGRELILQKPRTVSLPSTSEPTPITWLLLARFKETSEYPKRSNFDSACYSGNQSSFFLESPEFLWKLDKEWKPHDGVPLASVTIDSTGAKKNAEFVEPRQHGLARRRVFTGATLAGSTEWEAWNENIAGANFRLGFQVNVDTSRSGFTQRPCYFASLQWVPRNPTDQVFLIAPFQHLLEESIKGFRFRIWLPRLSVPGPTASMSHIVNPDAFSVSTARQRLYVSWLAIDEGFEST